MILMNIWYEIQLNIVHWSQWPNSTVLRSEDVFLSQYIGKIMTLAPCVSWSCTATSSTKESSENVTRLFSRWKIFTSSNLFEPVFSTAHLLPQAKFRKDLSPDVAHVRCYSWSQSPTLCCSFLWGSSVGPVSEMSSRRLCAVGKYVFSMLSEAYSHSPIWSKAKQNGWALVLPVARQKRVLWTSGPMEISSSYFSRLAQRLLVCVCVCVWAQCGWGRRLKISKTDNISCLLPNK